MGIRIAEIKDAESIAGFQIAMAHETENKILDNNTIINGVKAVIENKTLGFYLVYEDDDKACGSLMITFEWSDWRNGLFWWIQSVYILPEYRGKGIYSMFYQHVKLLGKENNVLGFRLYVDKYNEHARKIYKKSGMMKTNYRLYEEIV